MGDADANLGVLTADPVQATRVEAYPPASEHRPRPRKMQWLKMGDVQIVNTHLSYHKDDTKCRRQQAAFLAEQLEAEGRTIVCGISTPRWIRAC